MHKIEMIDPPAKTKQTLTVIKSCHFYMYNPLNSTLKGDQRIKISIF